MVVVVSGQFQVRTLRADCLTLVMPLLLSLIPVRPAGLAVPYRDDWKAKVAAEAGAEACAVGV
jgi:hypothetical protein